MYFPLQLRLPLLFTLLLGVALWFFGNMVYTQAAQRAYSELDNSLSSRAASVRLGKSLACSTGNPAAPYTLPSVDSLGTGGVAIEVLDNQMNLLATTDDNSSNFLQPGVDGLGSSPVPWDAHAARLALQKYNSSESIDSASLYSTITYQGQHVRVYSLVNNSCAGQVHIIQTAHSEQDIEQSLSNLNQLLLRGSILVIALTLLGGWLLIWIVLATVRRMTRTAQNISKAQDFSQRVPDTTFLGRDELSTLATTFNAMLTSLQESYQRQQRFVADASHELRAPITSIRCNLDLLAKAPDLPANEAKAALVDVQAEANRMGRLVNDLLMLARSDSSQINSINGYRKIDTAKQVVDLDSLLLEVFRQYRLTSDTDSGDDGTGGQRLRGPRLLLQDITPVKVYGDGDQLKQVLVALLDNALKYTPYEGQVSLSLTTNEEYAFLKVSDSGIGILPEDLPHIFERFYRADRTRSRERGGSGLGLTIAQSIAQEQQGVIEVESTPGKGSTFTLKMPIADEEGR